MSFTEEILKYRSVAVAGLEKNTGKTECLNFMLRAVKEAGHAVAVTSIGVDGETNDRVTHTPKPEIKIFEGMIFVTSERHFRQRQLTAEVLGVSESSTALGRLVTARAVTPGKVLLSGPPGTEALKRLLKELEERKVATTLIDGALSRLSHSSPDVAEAMVLATGAAVSASIPLLVRKTRYVYDLLRLEECDSALAEKLAGRETGILAIGEDGIIQDTGVTSAFMTDQLSGGLFRFGRRLYAGGAVTDRLLCALRMQRTPVELIVRDFTRIFARPETFYSFLAAGGRIKVLKRTRLLAVCINPQSPAGFCLDSGRLKEALEKEMEIPVYDIRKINKND